jgi:hypothetical protein
VTLAARSSLRPEPTPTGRRLCVATAETGMEAGR